MKEPNFEGKEARLKTTSFQIMTKGEERKPQKRGLQRKVEEVWQEIVVQNHRRFRSQKQRKRITETFPYLFSQHCPVLVPQQNLNTNTGFFSLSLNLPLSWALCIQSTELGWAGLMDVEPTLT